MVRAVYLSAIGGWVLNLAMTKALPRNPNAYAAVAFGGPGDAFLVNAAPRLFEAAVGPGLARFLVLISIVAQYFCGLASVTANSRMIYAFSRDRALPGSGLWSRINPRTRTPTNSVWLGVGLAAAVGAVSIYQRGGVSTAFFALTGITVIGLYISYAIPIFLRLRSTTFEPGPWNLRGRHRIVGWTSLAWVGFITVLFVGPLFRPFWPPFGITRLGGQTPGDPSDDVAVYHQNNMNFTGPIVVIAALGFALYWLLSARRWFEGPRSQGTPDELAAIEQRLTDGSEVGGSR
jgi:amino acid transporter